MRRLLILCVLLSGCASRATFTTAPVIANLNGYVANEKARLWQDGDGCHLVIAMADGQLLAPTVSDEVCQRGRVWTQAQAAVPKPAAAPPANPGDPK